MTPLFKRDGTVAICRGCRRTYEGTATFAIEHAAQCQHQRLYDALYRYERNLIAQGAGVAGGEVLYGCAARAEVVFAILVDLSEAPKMDRDFCLVCSLRPDQHVGENHRFERRP